MADADSDTDLRGAFVQERPVVATVVGTINEQIADDTVETVVTQSNSATYTLSVH